MTGSIRLSSFTGLPVRRNPTALTGVSRFAHFRSMIIRVGKQSKSEKPPVQGTDGRRVR